MNDDDIRALAWPEVLDLPPGVSPTRKSAVVCTAAGYEQIELYEAALWHVGLRGTPVLSPGEFRLALTASVEYELLFLDGESNG